MDYKFNEGSNLRGIKQYIDDTYSEHYANSKYHEVCNEVWKKRW